jgi:RNA polymerase sigma-70 factor (ECF subfamily)
MPPSYTGVTPSDSAVVRRVLDGDVEAFALLVDRYSGRCARYASRVLGDPDEADEVVQEAFVRAYRALGDYRERDRFAAWLFRILINQCRTAAQRAATRDRAFPRLDPDEAGDQLAYDDGAADRYAERDRLERALARLRPEQREAVVLRLGEELTYDEMAAVTGAGVSALKMRVTRAVARLRELLTEVHCV